MLMPSKGQINFTSILGGLDTSEPWQGQWNGGVLVECVGRPDNQLEIEPKIEKPNREGLKKTQ